jgi:hypothetical protein
MGLTTQLQYPYPEPTDSVDVVRDVKALADRNELVAAPFFIDTGWTKTGLVYSSGYQESNPVTGYQSLRYRRLGQTVWINGVLWKPATPVVAGDSMFTMPVGLRPVSTFISARATIDPQGVVLAAFPFAAGQAFGLDLRYLIG